MGSEVLFQGMLAAEAGAGAVATAVLGAEVAHFQVAGSAAAAAVVAARVRAAAHSVVAGHPVVEDSAAAAAVAQAETRVVGGRIGRLEEAQSTAADLDADLSHISGGSRWSM